MPILLALCARAQAAHPLITEDTGTQGEGGYQLELMVDAARDDAAGATTRILQPAAVLSAGVLPNADLLLTLPYQRLRTDGALAQGPLDAALDFKWRFYERGALSFGLKPGITLPTGDEREGLGSGEPTWGALLILTYQPGPLAVYSHLGYRRNRNSVGQRESLRHLSGALAWQIEPRLKLVADQGWDTDPDSTSGASLRYLVLGAIWSQRQDLDLDAGVKLGRGGEAIDHSLLLGVTLRW